MGLLIRGGEVINAHERLRADVYVEGEQISQVGLNLEIPLGTEEIDATGKLLFPGFIDPHVHIYLPFMSTFAKDTHATASRAALLGGTTSFIEMVCPSRNQDALTAYHYWKQLAEGSSACDYAFHMGVSKFDSETEAQLREIVADGTTSFKIFLSYKDFFAVSDSEMLETLRLAAKLGVVTAAHCENAELISHRQRELLSEGKTGPEWHEPSRPEFIEAEGTERFATFLEATGATGYVVHLSCIPALRAAVNAKLRGVRISIESVLPHFLLDKTFAERDGIEGMKYVMSPPLRAKHNLDALWAALQNGLIDAVGTDHCPFDTEQKLLGGEAFTEIPNGIPGIEERVNLIYTNGVKRGVLDICRFVDALSTRPAKIFGLFPRKGVISPGADADLVVYDPDFRGTISAQHQATNNDYNGFEGLPIEGRPDVVTVRGKVKVRGGQFIGDTKSGQFLRRRPLGAKMEALHAN